MKKKIAIINGVNNNFYGIRDIQKYGTVMYQDLVAQWTKYGESLGFEVDVFQSNCEGKIVDYMQKCYFDQVAGIVLNPAAFTHYSYALYDAIRSISIPTIEVHMDNVFKREEFRHTSVTVPACIGMIAGFGPNTYCLAMDQFKGMMDKGELA